jgi:hypothetical protein
MLGELAELALMMARDLAVRARESEDTEETVGLTAAFQKTSRVVRLTLALDFKLERTAASEAKAAADEAQAAERRLAQVAPDTETQDTPNPIAARKARVQNLLNRVIWTESESDQEDYEVLFDDLSARLDEAALSPDFQTLSIEALGRRVIADMGLSGDLTLSLCEMPGETREEGIIQPPLADTG